MFVVLLENANNIVLSDVSVFLSKYPKSSIKYITRYTTAEELHALGSKPLLSLGWLIICQDLNIKKSYLKFLKELDYSNLILFRITNKQKCLDFISSLKADKTSYKFINNYKLDDEKILNYVHSNLNITKADAKYLCNRSGYYLPDIVKNVQTLRILDKITKPIIRKYTEERKSIAVYDLVNYLIGLDSRITYEDCMNLLYSYRYGFEHLVKTTLAQVTLYVKVYQLILDGELTIVNYKSQKENITDKDISGMHDFRLYKIIESFDKVSYDYLILLQIRLKQIPSNFYAGVLDFVLLLKINAGSSRVSTQDVQIATIINDDLKDTQKRLTEFNKDRNEFNIHSFIKSLEV